MNKFYGAIGYAIQSETSPGVWQDEIVERNYRGDILQNNKRWRDSGNVNDDYTIDNQLSIISDPFALANFQYIKYVCWMGAKWKITKIEIRRPRLILTTGALYNGPA